MSYMKFIALPCDLLNMMLNIILYQVRQQRFHEVVPQERRDAVFERGFVGTVPCRVSLINVFRHGIQLTAPSSRANKQALY